LVSDAAPSIFSDVVGWRPSPDGLNTDIILAAPDGSRHALTLDTAALMHLVPIAAATQQWRNEAEAENARTVRTFMDVDRFVVGLDVNDPEKMMLSVRLTSGGTLTLRLDRQLTINLANSINAAGP
jgi:hypothetical protein